MSRQENPFAILDDDDEEDVSVLLAKVEAKKPSLTLPVTEQAKRKIGINGFPSKALAPRESVRVDRGRGRGGIGREIFYDRGYIGEYGGRGRGVRGVMGRGWGRGFNGFVYRNQMDYMNAGNGGEVGSEFQEKGYYGENWPYKYDNRRFGDENQGPNGVVRDDRDIYGLRGYVYGRSYFVDGGNRGYRGGEGRGRVFGGRGWWGGRDGGRFGGGRSVSNNGLNAYETKKASANEKAPNDNSKINGDGGSGRNHRNATEGPTNSSSEKPTPEQIASADTSKVPEAFNEMTLSEYEKLLQEKRKSLESLKMEVRKVVADKDFEGMQIIEKKKEDDITKVVFHLMDKLENDKGKKKEFNEREDKSRKSQSINEFLKPADGERYRGAAAASGERGGGRGRGRGGYISDHPRQPVASASTPSLEDPVHFPNLGAMTKA